MNSNDPWRPRYLRPADDAWLEKLRAMHADLAGGSLSSATTFWAERGAPELRSQGAPPAAIDGVRRVLDRLSTTRIAAPIAPASLREAVFPLAARVSRARAIDEAAAALGVPAGDVPRFLFADRRAERLVVGPTPMPTLADLRERYNLELVQSWLMKCSELRAIVRENVRSVVRFAKLVGLLVAFAEIDGVVELRVSGPLALFRRTVKYGRALARFFPAVVATPGYRATADCVHVGKPRKLEVRAGDPIHAAHRLPRSADSAIERALVRELRRLSTPWTVLREDRVVRLPEGGMFFPDFSLVCGARRVLVEVVGFHTAEYLRRKVLALRAVREPCIVCVDAALDCGSEGFAGDVLLFHRRIDAGKLVELAERITAQNGPLRAP